VTKLPCELLMKLVCPVDWLTSQLKSAFYKFCFQVPAAGGRCDTKTVIHLLSNTVYCLNLFVCLICDHCIWQWQL